MLTDTDSFIKKKKSNYFNNNEEMISPFLGVTSQQKYIQQLFLVFYEHYHN